MFVGVNLRNGPTDWNFCKYIKYFVHVILFKTFSIQYKAVSVIGDSNTGCSSRNGNHMACL